MELLIIEEFEKEFFKIEEEGESFYAPPGLYGRETLKSGNVIITPSNSNSEHTIYKSNRFPVTPTTKPYMWDVVEKYY